MKKKNHFRVNEVLILFRYWIYFFTYIKENNRIEKHNVIKAMGKESDFRDRLNSYEFEKFFEELTTKSDEYLKTEGCGGELRKREIVENCTCNACESCDKDQDRNRTKSRPKLDRRQSSIVGFDSENFPFKSLGDFLPSFETGEDVGLEFDRC